MHNYLPNAMVVTRINTTTCTERYMVLKDKKKSMVINSSFIIDFHHQLTSMGLIQARPNYYLPCQSNGLTSTVVEWFCNTLWICPVESLDYDPPPCALIIMCFGDNVLTVSWFW